MADLGTTTQDVQTTVPDNTAQAQNAASQIKDTSTSTQDITPVSWLETLPEDLRSNEAFKAFKDHGEFAKAFLDTKTKSDEMTAKITDLEARLPKVADTPEGYKVNIPEGLPTDPQFVSAMQTLAQKSGMGVDQFQSFADGYMAIQKAYMDEIKSTGEKAENALRIEWGKDYEANDNIALQTFKKFFPSEDEAQYMKDTGFGKDPVLKRGFCRVGKAMAEDTFPTVEGGTEKIQRDASGNPRLSFKKSLPDLK